MGAALTELTLTEDDMTTTARSLIIAKIAHLDGTEQCTTTVLTPGVEYVATLVVTDDDVRIEYSAVDCDGEPIAHNGDTCDLTHADCDELLEAIVEELGGGGVTAHAKAESIGAHVERVTIELSTSTTPRNGDGGDIRYVCTTAETGADKAIEINDAGSRAQCRLVIIDEARSGQSVTGYDVDQRDERQERDARAALIRLGDAIGYIDQ